MASASLVTVPGTRLIHSVRRVGDNILQTRWLSCFCAPCLDGNEARCENSAFVDQWETVKLRFTAFCGSVGNCEAEVHREDQVRAGRTQTA